MRFGMLVAAVAVLTVQPAVAATQYVTLTGTLTEQTAAGDAVPFGVGSQLRLTARFDPAAAVDWGDSGYQIVGFERFADTFKIEMGDFVWRAEDDFLDGLPFYLFENASEQFFLGYPALAIKDGKVAGVMGQLIPSFSATPILDLGSSAGFGSSTWCDAGTPCVSSFQPLGLSGSFRLQSDFGTYGNIYGGPEFNGVWNFAQSAVGVPEPATWTLMILGIGAAGAAMRRRRASPTGPSRQGHLP